MENTKFVRVSEAVTNAILERKQVRPVFLHRNSDNSFTAVFDDKLEPGVREDIEESDKTIVVLEDKPVEAQQPVVQSSATATVRFAFTSQPEVDLT